MSRIVMEREVPEDGILHLRLSLGAAGAGRRVRVTVESTQAAKVGADDERRARILETAGAWRGEFERPSSGAPEEREPFS